MKFLFLLAVIAVIAIIFLKAKQRTRNAGNSDSPKISTPAPYFGKTVLSDPEQSLFIRLMEAMPEKVILAQVAVPALIGIRKNQNWQAQFNEISKKYVDFVVCNPDFTVYAVIELDDMSHQRGDRIKADAIKDVAFEAAGFRMIRFDVREMPDVETIKSKLTQLS